MSWLAVRCLCVLAIGFGVVTDATLGAPARVESATWSESAAACAQGAACLSVDVADRLVQRGWCGRYEDCLHRLDFDCDGVGDLACQTVDGNLQVLLVI